MSQRGSKNGKNGTHNPYVDNTITEHKVDLHLGKQLKDLGCLYYKWVSPGRAGVPDRIIITPKGRVIFAELKTDLGRLSPAQRYQIKMLSGCGVDVRVVQGIPGADALALELGAELAGQQPHEV